MNINKIIITGDVLRPSENGKANNQTVNINWLYHLLSRPLSLSTPLPIEVLHWSKEADSFDSIAFYKLNQHNSFPSDWIALYHKEGPFHKDLLAYMEQYFQNALVIGFELPEIFVNLFNELNIVYIDLIIHPIRYLDDIFFGFRTNDETIFQALQKHQLHSDHFLIHAGIHHATVSRMSQKTKLAAGSALFTGQVEIDKSLVKGDQILSLLDFKDEFGKIAQQYNKIYFKKHPYAKDNHAVNSFLQTFDNIEFIDENFYYLLGQDEITAVYSISSSTVLEAKYWGKHSEYFYKNPFKLAADNDQPFDSKAYIPIYDSFLEPTFWSSVLEQLVPTNQTVTLSLPNKSNRLRNSLQNYWGYNFLDSEILFKHAAPAHTSAIELNNSMSIEEMLKTLQPATKTMREHLMKKQQKQTFIDLVKQRFRHTKPYRFLRQSYYKLKS